MIPAASPRPSAGVGEASRARAAFAMPQFDYRAMDPAGRRIVGVLAGASEQAVLTELESRQLVPVWLGPRPEARRRLGVGGRVSARRLSSAYIQLADLLRAGVPLLRGLKLLGAGKSQPHLAQAFRAVAEKVAAGSELAEAMADHPDLFPRVHVAMVRAGEKGGFLEPVFSRLGQFVAGQAELRGKLIGNLIYPAVLVSFGTIMLGLVFGVFIPMFQPMFDRLGDRLPTISKVVFAISHAVGRLGPLLLVAAALAAIGLWRLIQRPGPRRAISIGLTRAPVVGPLLRTIAAARFCRMLGTMLSNGIPVLSAMQIAKDAAGNVLMELAIERAADEVKAGRSLAGPLGESGLFDPDVIEMIAVGESANNLGDVLVNIAQTIESRVDRLLSGAMKLVEPVLLIILGLIIAMVAAALILPMTRMTAAI